jgi:probable F420-dependent oxidoreductase
MFLVERGVTVMLIGLGAPTRGNLANKSDLQRVVERAEALGFQSLWIPDHIVIPSSFAPNYPYAADGRPTFPAVWLEQLTAMAWLAGITENMKLVTSVMVVPHRRPMHTAKILSTIDVLSEGRVILGCGAGWMEEEFVALDTEPFAERGRVTDEYIGVFRELWTADAPSFDGDYTRFADIVFEPQPVQQPSIPIWIGGEGGRAMRRVVELGDGWMPIGANPKHPLHTVELYKAGLERLTRRCEKAGRDPSAITRAYFAVWPSNAPPFEPEDGKRFLCTGTSEQIAEDINALSDAGVEHLLLNFVRPTVEETLDEMDRFSSDVRPMLNV